MLSCTPKSARQQFNNLTKVVILDSTSEVDIRGNMYQYKVKFIKYNTSDYIYSASLYEQNDTILVVDKYYNNTIR